MRLRMAHHSTHDGFITMVDVRDRRSTPWSGHALVEVLGHLPHFLA
jgi:hypothetical protein